MKSKNNLEDTQDLDAKEIRKASSAPKKNPQGKQNVKKPVNKKSTSQAKKPASKKTANAVKKQPVNSQNKTAGSKIRYFPQVEQEAKQKQKKKKLKIDKKLARKIKGIFVFAVISLVIITAVVIFGIYQIFKIKTVTVNYEFEKSSKSETVKRKYSDEQIKRAGDINIGDNLVFFDVEKKAEKINENLPYLKVDSIDKKGFSKLIINAKQIKPKYSFVNGATYILTDENFEVIDEINNKKEASKYTLVTNAKIKQSETGHIVAFGDKANKDERASALYENELISVFSAIKASEIKKITYINLKNLDDIYMVYDGRITIQCGEKGTLTDKLKLAVKTLEAEDKNSTNQTGTLNLTIDKKAYFTPD